MRLTLMAFAILFLWAAAAAADPVREVRPGNPDARPSLTLLGGLGDVGGAATRGWSATFALPFYRDATILGTYVREEADLGESTLRGIRPVAAWAFRAGIRIYL